MVSEPCHDPMAGSKDAAKAAAGAKPPERTPSKPRSRSRRDASLSPVRRGRSPGRAHGRELVVRERVVRDGGGSSKWPVLMRTNYADWSVIMRVQLQVHGLWDAVTEDDVDEHDDRAALSALLQAVPPELVRTLAAGPRQAAPRLRPRLPVGAPAAVARIFQVLCCGPTRRRCSSSSPATSCRCSTSSLFHEAAYRPELV